jgi:ABC-type tungstate transport system permease subunit
LEAASALSEYTLTDRGTWLSSPASVTQGLKIFKAGSDNADDPLLNPAHVLLGSNVDSANVQMSKLFMKWVAMKTEGQKVIAGFKKSGEVLYSEAPDSEDLSV